MIHSFIFSEGKTVGRDLELEALRLVQADKGLIKFLTALTAITLPAILVGGGMG